MANKAGLNPDIVVVDSKDNFVRLEKKIKCHLEGIRHRAFSVILFDKKGRMLIHKRSRKKMLWALYWTGACCSHPRHGENFEAAAERRLFEEAGIKGCKPKFHFKFNYKARFRDIGWENEVCAVLTATYSQLPKTNPEEVEEWKFIEPKELLADIKRTPGKYTPWFKKEIRLLMGKDIIKPK